METVKRDYMPKDTVEFGPKAAAQELSIKSIWFEFLEAQNPTVSTVIQMSFLS